MHKREPSIASLLAARGKSADLFTPNRSLTVIETEDGTPNGYSAPGMLFLAPKAIGTSVNPRLLVNQIARQWWGVLTSPATRNHLWLLRGSSFGGVERAGYALAYVRALATYLWQSPSKPAALRTAARGIRDGLRRQPA